VQEVLYEDLHDTLRALYHAALGRALERIPGQAEGARAVLLADHFLRGGVPEAAGRYVRAALEHLEWKNHEFGRSGDLAARALEHPDALSDPVRAFALEVHGRALVMAGEFDTARPVVEEAIRLAHAVSDVEVEIDARHRLAWLHMREARIDEAIEYMQRAAALAHEAGDEGREAVAHGRLAMYQRRAGNPDEAKRQLELGFAALEGSDDLFARARLLSDRATIALQLGHIEEARVAFREAKELAHAVGDVPTEFLLAAEWGRFAFREGRVQDAYDAAHRAVDLGRQIGTRHMEAFLLTNMARCLVRLGRLEEALTRADAAVTLSARTLGDGARKASLLSRSAVRTALGALEAAQEDLDGVRAEPDRDRDTDPATLLNAARMRARLLGLLGRHAEAEQALDEADAMVSARTPPGTRAGLKAQRGQLFEQQGRWDEAARQHDEAVALAVDAPTGTAPYALGRGRALREAGRQEEAAVALQDALAWAQETGHIGHATVAQVLLAALPGGDPLVARMALESHEESLPVADRVEAYAASWEATGEASDLEGAWRALRRLRDGAPAADREHLLTEVVLHRRVAEAARPTQG